MNMRKCLPQQLYSVHLGDHTEDCTVQLSDHIKVRSHSLYMTGIQGNRHEDDQFNRDLIWEMILCDVEFH